MQLHQPAYQGSFALVMSVLLYSAETWTLLVADLRKIEPFHMKCLKQLLCVNWQDRVNSSSVPQQTGLMTIISYLSRRRLSLFGHVARLDERVPAHTALRLMTDVHNDWKKSDERWRRPCGRLRYTWLKTQTSRRRLCGHWR